MLNMVNVKKGHGLANNRENGSFNCWGATLFGLGQIDKLYWVRQGSMENFLYKETIEIEEKDLKKGDILALYNETEGLIHTALYVGNDMWWHKVGGLHSEFTSKEKVIETYEHYEIDYTELRRKIK